MQPEQVQVRGGPVRLVRGLMEVQVIIVLGLEPQEVEGEEQEELEVIT